MYTLDNGRDIHAEFPETFEVPELKQIQALETGAIVKLIFREDSEVERMWVIITEISRNQGKHMFQGKLDNQPYGLTTIEKNDMVCFSEEHIIQIHI